MVSNLYAGLSSFHLVLTDTNIPDSRQHGAGHLQWISNGLRGEYLSIQFVQTQPSVGGSIDYVLTGYWTNKRLSEQQQGRWWPPIPTNLGEAGLETFATHRLLDAVVILLRLGFSFWFGFRGSSLPRRPPCSDQLCRAPATLREPDWTTIFCAAAGSIPSTGIWMIRLVSQILQQFAVEKSNSLGSSKGTFFSRCRCWGEHSWEHQWLLQTSPSALQLSPSGRSSSCPAKVQFEFSHSCMCPGNNSRTWHGSKLKMVATSVEFLCTLQNNQLLNRVEKWRKRCLHHWELWKVIRVVSDFMIFHDSHILATSISSKKVVVDKWNAMEDKGHCLWRSCVMHCLA